MAVIHQHEKTDHHWRLRRLALSRVAKSLRPQNLKIVFAASREQYTEAFRLTYQRYLEAGIINSQSNGLWLTPFHALEDTRVAIAYFDGVPVCTATIIFDSEFGLPSDDIYQPELNKLRQQGRQLAELSSLAALPSMPSQNTLFSLFRFLFRYVVARGSSDLIISAHPKHADFYSRILLFEQYGPLRNYPKFIEAKAVLKRLEIATAEKSLLTSYRNFPDSINLFKFFFTESIGDQQQQFCRSTGLAMEDFVYFFKQSSFGPTTPPAFHG